MYGFMERNFNEQFKHVKSKWKGSQPQSEVVYEAFEDVDEGMQHCGLLIRKIGSTLLWGDHVEKEDVPETARKCAGMKFLCGSEENTEDVGLMRYRLLGKPTGAADCGGAEGWLSDIGVDI